MPKQISLAVAGAVFLGLACAGRLTYGLIGQEIASDGTLVEPFALIPLSLLSALIGIVLLTISGAVFVVGRLRSSRR